MWSLARLPEFHRACHAANATWDAQDAANLRFLQGLLFSFVAVTPFWAAVGIGLHLLTK
jgi:hypothetical protein